MSTEAARHYAGFADHARDLAQAKATITALRTQLAEAIGELGDVVTASRAEHARWAKLIEKSQATLDLDAMSKPERVSELHSAIEDIFSLRPLT